MKYEIDFRRTEVHKLGSALVFLSTPLGASIIVPLTVAQSLLDEPAPPEDESESAPDEPISPMRSLPAAAKKRVDPTHVEIASTLPWQQHVPVYGQEIKIWEERQVLEVIARHNSGAGDNGHRQDQAAKLREMMERGPWRPLITPAAPERLAAMRESCGNFNAVLDIIETAHATSPSTPFAPLLLVSPPGVGKTFFAQLIADYLAGDKFCLIDAASLQSNSLLLGTEPHWSTARPGLLFDLLVTGKTANPVIVVDEFCKLSRHPAHDPQQQFHAALEPASARAITDLYSDVTMNASRVRWIFTANSLAPIPKTLLSRMQLISIGEPGPREMLAIAKSVAKATIDKEAPAGFEPISRDVAVELAPFPARTVRMLVTAAIRRAIWAGRHRITLDDLGARPPQAYTLH